LVLGGIRWLDQRSKALTMGERETDYGGIASNASFTGRENHSSKRQCNGGKRRKSEKSKPHFI
jgi:hypothetical protein